MWAKLQRGINTLPLPGVFRMKSSELLRLLKRDGWYEIRQTGSHIIMNHPFKKNKVIVPFHS